MDYTKIVTEVVIVVLGYFGSLVLHKAQGYLNSLKSKNHLTVATTVTEQVVKWAEAQLSGSNGKEKRDFAVKKALEILAAKGINVDESSVIAGIEDGVSKLKEQQLNTKSVEAYFTPPSIPQQTQIPQ
jgi:LL-H family phage holin